MVKRWITQSMQQSTGCLYAASLFLLFGIGVTGCDDDSPPVSSHQVVVEVSDVLDNTPAEDIKLILMDPDQNHPVSDPVLTDSHGTASFRDLPQGRYVVLAYPGGGWGIEHQPGPFSLPQMDDDRVVLASDKADRGLLGQLFTAPHTSPLLSYLVSIRAFRDAQFDDGLPRIAGVIVDADTDLPLARAFVGMPAHVTAYVGELGVDNDVTGADGRFLAARIPFASDPETENIFQVVPLVVTREGYVPVTWFHHPAPGDDNLDITGVQIALRPIAAGHSGRLTGRVTWLGEPVAGVAVGLAFVAPSDAAAPASGIGSDCGGTTGSVGRGDRGDIEADHDALGDGDREGGGGGKGRYGDSAKGSGLDPGCESLVFQSGVGVPGQIAMTDSTGTFAFEGVTAGWYLVHPGFQPDDAYVYFRQTATRPYEVAAGGTTRTDTLAVLAAIFPLEPVPGQTFTETLRVFRWSGVAAADSYRVYLDRGELGTFADTEVYLPSEDTVGPGLHVWSVEGIRRDGTYVGWTEQQYRFRILTPKGR